MQFMWHFQNGRKDSGPLLSFKSVSLKDARYVIKLKKFEYKENQKR